MPKSSPTRNRRSNDQANDQHHQVPKPCHTCARVITPRAKWERNWDEIRFCSSSCKSQRPGKLVRWQASDSSEANFLATPSALSISTTHEADLFVTDLEAWVEAALFETAKKSAEGRLATCEDVEARLTGELDALAHNVAISTGQQEGPTIGADPDNCRQTRDHPLSSALRAPPGQRERVRRAARRLAILESSLWALARLQHITFKGHVQLFQRNKQLTSLEDVSFAKGPIGLHWNENDAVAPP
ncbi:Uncharacterised conserved protein UCP037205 [Ceraceosorus bombacis]|uniref:Uncharacterized conserved protein UCP037205 n=1 Tax=Ceraceosorus bombacis TaxID=401625 RepID=A0A0P1BP88_9BASI|nr:Uncharacterised conserved protein UCP037205 [Ceraceosorus bombacis]